MTHTDQNKIDLLATLPSDDSSSAQSFLLPRSAWQNEEALLKVLVKTKRMLDIVELSTVFD